MTKVSNRVAYKKKTPTASDSFFGSDTDDNGEFVRFDMESVAALIKELNDRYPSSNIKINSYFPSGW